MSISQRHRNTSQPTRADLYAPEAPRRTQVRLAVNGKHWKEYSSLTGRRLIESLVRSTRYWQHVLCRSDFKRAVDTAVSVMAEHHGHPDFDALDDAITALWEAERE